MCDSNVEDFECVPVKVISVTVVHVSVDKSENS